MTQATKVPTITLNNGVEIPQLGFGNFQVAEDQAEAVVSAALEAGYRSIDTARIYDNERATGAAIAASGIPRDELFVTTKLWNSDQGFDSTLAAFEGSRARLGLDVVDCYLIHWPTSDQAARHETWRALEQLLADGAVRSIGVSNFHVHHLEALLDAFDIVPAMNQVELHPYLQQKQLRAFHAQHGIATEAWGPLGQGKLLDEPTIAKIAARLDRSVAQVMLRWHLDIGNVVIPKSATQSRIVENFDVLDIELTSDDLDAINALDRSERFGPDPDSFG